MVIRYLANYVNGQWVTPNAAESLEVRNPATAEILARVPHVERRRRRRGGPVG